MEDVLNRFSWIYSGEDTEEEEEYRDTGWHDVSVSRDGNFKRNGIPIKVKIWHGTTPVVCCRSGVKRHEVNANLLVAKAWHPDYYEGCFIIPKDGDKLNIHIDNLSVAEPDEFFKYRGERMIEKNKPKQQEWDAYGEFRKTPVEGLDCTVEGVFRKNHRLLKVHRCTDALGRKCRAKVVCNVNGVRTTLNAAKLVAMTWSPQSWTDGSMIWFKDGDKHNIHSDNLIVVSESKYYREFGNANKRIQMTFEESYAKVRRRARETAIALGYFDTGDFAELNGYVEKELLPFVLRYALSNGFSMLKAKEVAGEVISLLYEWIVAYRPITDYTLFCMRLIRIYKKTGGFGFYERIPNPLVNNNVSLLNLDSLCERYKSTKMK